MNRSPEILAQIQQIRLNRKNQKIPTPLKRLPINASQKNRISVTKKGKNSPNTQKNTEIQNSLYLAFSIGFHFILATLIGVICFSNQMVYQDDVLMLELIVFNPKVRYPHPPHPPNPPGRYFTTSSHPHSEQIQREPVITPTDLTQIHDTFVLSDKDVSSLNNKQQSIEIIQNATLPPQQSNLKLRPVLIIDKPTPKKSTIVKFTQTNSDEGNGLKNQPDVYTETIPQQTTPIIHPNYPKFARLVKKEGKVILQAIIGIDGIPKKITATTNIGYGLEEAAIETFKKCRYIPAKKNGIPFASSVEIEFEFKIQE